MSSSRDGSASGCRLTIFDYTQQVNKSLKYRPLAWREERLPLSTSSNEACKLYDATVTQYVGWYDDASVGGIEGSLTKMMETDPNFVMGHVLGVGLELMGTGRNPKLDASFMAQINTMNDVASKAILTDREKLHADAMKLLGEGKMVQACDVWEDILVQHPTDILALKFGHDAYFYLGYQPQMRDSVARVLPYWKETQPLYGYLLGMHSFGLCETNLYAEGEKVSRKGLEINPRDGWSTHSLAHVLEMQGRYNEGITFLSSTVRDWSSCGMIACHDFWHWAVYHIEKGEHQGALDIFDGEVSQRAKSSGAMLDIVDACSMLYRLELEGVKVGDRWKELYDVCQPHNDDHLLAFNDAHLLMTYLGCERKDTADQLISSMKEFVKNGTGTNHTMTSNVGLTLCEAFVAYSNGEYSQAVDMLLPKRYDVITIGGSNAQRDVFSQFLIHAAVKSSCVEHNKLALALLTERKALKNDSPLTDRLVAKAMSVHKG